MIELKNTVTNSEKAVDNKEESQVDKYFEIVKTAVPAYLLNMSKQNLDMLKSFVPTLPGWLTSASQEQRAEARRVVESSVIAHTQLTDVMAGVKPLQAFAEPLLKQKISEVFALDLNVNETWIELTPHASLIGTTEKIEYFTLLQAALNNFEEKETDRGHFFGAEIFTYGPKKGIRKRVSLSAERFINMCRELDLGQQYQAHIKKMLKWDDVAAQARLNEVFVGYQKAALKAASTIALIKGNIESKHHNALLDIISGQKTARVDGKAIWHRSLSFMGMALHGCVIFEIAEPDESLLDKFLTSVNVGSQSGLIAYIPDDPDHPVKYYASLAALKARLISQLVRKNPSALRSLEAATDYQKFFSRFVKCKDLAKYFTSFTEQVPRELLEDRRREPKRRQKQAPDFLLQLRVLDPSGKPWLQEFDIWTTLYKEHKTRLLLDARSQAVPSEEADAKGRRGLIAELFEDAFVLLNVASFLVPAVGLVMLSVTAVQLMYEVLEGVEDLSLGDKEVGWRHIVDVVENLSTGAATVAVFGVLHTDFTPIELADGQARLWKPDLRAYRSEVSLESIQPNARGQYQIADRHYVRVAGDVFEKRFDPVIGKWRIQHPKTPQAYQPILEDSIDGQWRHTLDRSLSKPSVGSSINQIPDEVTDQSASGNVNGERDVVSVHPLPVSTKGISNVANNRYAVAESSIEGLSSSKGIYRSIEGQRFYIRNIDETGTVAVYQVRDSFNFNADLVDVNIVDPANNRATELRLWQIKPDQWHPLSLKGGFRNSSLISARDLLDWNRLSSQVPETYTLRKFATDRGLFLSTLQRYVRADGSLTAEGFEFLEIDKTPRQSIKAEHLVEWERLSARERHELTREGFANRHRLDAADFMNYVNQDGTLGSTAKELINEEAPFTSSGLGQLLFEATADPAMTGPGITRKKLPNGLWEPVIAVGEQRNFSDVGFEWGEYHHNVPFTAGPIDIRKALSVPEFSRVIIDTNLFDPVKARYSASVSAQLRNSEGGGSSFIYSMQRMSYSGVVKGEFNAIKVVDIDAGEVPDQSNAVSGYWAAQGGYVDIPVHPEWTDPDHVFTPGFSGCSLLVDQLEDNVLRVRHVEGGKEDAQYNKLPAHEHGWGLAAAMEFLDYGVDVDQNGNVDSLLAGFAYMKYDRKTRVWNIHYQSIQGAPSISKYSTAKPGFFGQPDSYIKAYETSIVRKSMAKQVVTVDTGVGVNRARPTQTEKTVAAL